MCGSIFNVKINVIALMAIGVVVRDADAKRSRRIIGGMDAEANEFPWMARLIVMDTYGVHHGCGGAIISSRLILTSASCLRNINTLSIWTGFNIRDYNVAIKSRAALLIIHSKYKYHFTNDDTSVQNDIGIVVLDKDLELNEKQNAISLTDNETAVGTIAALPGWRFTGQSEGQQAMVLQKTTIKIEPSFLCPTRTENQLCGRSTSNATPRYGDAGNPLVVDGRVVGILSTIRPIIGGESIYTDVHYYHHWIMNVVDKNVRNIEELKNFYIFYSMPGTQITFIIV